MEIQDLNIAINKIQKLFIKNSKRSISATFRKLRKQYCLSSFGDYPIISIILRTAREMNIQINKQKFLYAFNQSVELSALTKKEKSELLGQLFKPSYVQTKLPNNVIKNLTEQRLISHPSI